MIRSLGQLLLRNSRANDLEWAASVACPVSGGWAREEHTGSPSPPALSHVESGFLNRLYGVMNKGGAGRAFASRSTFGSAAGAGSSFGCTAAGAGVGTAPGAGGGSLGSEGTTGMACSIRPFGDGADIHPEDSVSYAQTGLDSQQLFWAHAQPDRQTAASKPADTTMDRKVTGHPFPKFRPVQPAIYK